MVFSERFHFGKPYISEPIINTITIGSPNQGIEIAGSLVSTKRIALFLSSYAIYWVKRNEKGWRALGRASEIEYRSSATLVPAATTASTGSASQVSPRSRTSWRLLKRDKK